MELNFYDPYSEEYAHPAQQKYLEVVLNRAELHKETGGKVGIQKVNFHGGRGSGKTAIIVIDMALVALVYAPNFRTFWSELSYPDIDRILMPAMEDLIPSEYYEFKTSRNGHRYIKWESGHITDLISRFQSNSKKRAALGGNVIGGWFDEAATGWDQKKVDDILNSIRQKEAPFYFLSMVSTPLPNGFEVWCNAPDAVTINASSWDNPHLSKHVLDQRAKDMSPDQVQQELKGLFVPIGGRIWKYYTPDIFPKGNLVLNYSFDKTIPWYLSVDLGGHQSAAQVYQIYENRLLLVEEWTPNNLSFEDLLGEIFKEYCDGDYNKNKPQRVWIGHDVNTKNSITGSSGAKLLNDIGWSWTYPAGPLSSKDLQRQHSSNLLYSNQFLVSVRQLDNGKYKVKQHHGDRKKRGILNVLENDVYPENTKEIFNKDKGTAGVNALEDDRDCMLYAGALWKHPTLLSGKEFYKKL